MSIINLFWIPSIILFIILMFLNWKITLAVTVVGLFGGRILKFVAEHVIVFPLHKLLIKERQDNSF